MASFKKIFLTRGLSTVVDAADYEWLSQWGWYASFYGYAVRKEKIGDRWVVVWMHRSIMKTPKGMFTDHISGDRLDNRRSNLRICTRQQNSMNIKPREGTSSKFRGVYWSKVAEKWQAYINVDGKRNHLGLFLSEAEAAIAYNNAAVGYHGEFCRGNIL